MAAKIRLNKTIIATMVAKGHSQLIRDKEVSGLKFRVGKKRSVFLFEKRISGGNQAAITMTIGAFPAISLDEARQQARRLANLCERGIDPRKKQSEHTVHTILFSQAIDHFFDQKTELAKETLRSYHIVVRLQFDQTWLPMDIRQITPAMLVKQFHLVRQTAKQSCWEMLKLFTNIWNVCSLHFRGADGKTLLGPCPMVEARLLLKSISHETPSRTVIPKSHLGKLVKVIEDMRIVKPRKRRRRGLFVPTTGTVRTCNALLLCLFTGMRYCEAQHLRWDYVDLSEGIIRLPGRIDSPQTSFRGTKNKRDHWLPLSHYPWDLLKELHLERSSTSPFVFPQTRCPSKPISRFSHVFKEISQRSGCLFQPHACRRTFASIANEVGLGFLTVKRLLNHTYKGGITGGYIVQRFNPEKRRTHFQKIADFILTRKAEYVGKSRRKPKQEDDQVALAKLKHYAIELGLDPAIALKKLKEESRQAAR